MTEISYIKERFKENKKQLTIRLSPDTYSRLEKEIENLEKTEIGWNMSRIIDYIISIYFVQQDKKK